MSQTDRGWAWLVLTASFTLMMIIYGISWSTGVFNAIFLKYFENDDAATIAWAGSMVTSVLYFIAPISSVLTKRFGHRKTVMAGGLVASVGLLSSFFATSIYFLFATFGFLTGVGLGIVYVPTISCIPLYFEKYRNLAYGIAVSGLSVGTFIFPPIITVLAHAYSWRGAMLVIGGLTLNICVCGLLIRQVKKREFRREKSSNLDFGVFSKGYSLLCVCNVLISFALSLVYLQLTAFAEVNGISDEAAAMLISAIGIANLIGRLIVGAVGNHRRFKVFVVYAVSFLISGFAAAAYPLVLNSYPTMVVLSVVFGLFTATYGALMQAVVIELVGLHRLESGYGFLMPFMGIGQLTGGPFAGFIFDVSGSYKMSFYIGGAVLVTAGVMAFFLTLLPRKPDEDEEITLSVREEKRVLSS